VTRRGGPSRATTTARARARFQKGDDGTCARAVAARTSPPRVRRGGARARRRHWRCLLRRRAATGVTRFRKRARSRSRDAVPSKHAVRVDTNVTNEALALPEPRVPPWTAPSRRRARRVHEPASRLAAGRGCWISTPLRRNARRGRRGVRKTSRARSRGVDVPVG